MENVELIFFMFFGIFLICLGILFIIGGYKVLMMEDPNKEEKEKIRIQLKEQDEKEAKIRERIRARKAAKNG